MLRLRVLSVHRVAYREAAGRFDMSSQSLLVTRSSSLAVGGDQPEALGESFGQRLQVEVGLRSDTSEVLSLW
jgi:hypothetical protein